MKIAIYARVSTEKQEKQETIQSQISALKEYARNKQWIIVGEYIDEGYSGELLDRPALDKLRDDAGKQLFGAVLVHSPDRLARNYAYACVLEEELKKHDVKFVFLNSPDDANTPEASLLKNMQGVIAQYEKAKIIERTRRGRMFKARNGRLVGGKSPYGYRYILSDRTKGIDGRYVVDDDEAKVVKLIFDLFVSDRMSVRGIARELTRRGIRPREGKEWRTSSLHKIIRNETYTGTTYFNKHFCVEPKTVHERKTYRRRKCTSIRLRPKADWVAIALPKETVIIDKKTYENAQALLKRNFQTSPRNTKHPYLLRNLMKCGCCDSPYGGENYHGELYYRCGNRHRRFPLPANCKSSSVKAEKIEGLVWDRFTQVIQNPKLILSQINNLNARKHGKRAELLKEEERVEQQIIASHAEEAKLIDLYTRNIIDIDKFKNQQQVIESRRKELLGKKEQILKQLHEEVDKQTVNKSVQEYCRIIRDRLAGMENNFEEKRRLLMMAIKAIIFQEDRIAVKGTIPQLDSHDENDGFVSTSLECCEPRRRLSPGRV